MAQKRKKKRKPKGGAMGAMFGDGTGSPQDIKTFLERGGDVNAQDRFGQTALMRASFTGDAGFAKFLLERGGERKQRGMRQGAT